MLEDAIQVKWVYTVQHNLNEKPEKSKCGDQRNFYFNF